MLPMLTSDLHVEGAGVIFHVATAAKRLVDAIEDRNHSLSINAMEKLINLTLRFPSTALFETLV